MSNLSDRIAAMCRRAKKDPCSVRVLCASDRCAVALVTNTPEFLPDGWTFLDAVDRLEPEWLQACLDCRLDWDDRSD